MDQITRIEDKIDKLMDRQGEQSNMLAVHQELHKANSASLDHHIKRTDLLQKQVETALIPINIAKWTVAVAGGVTAILTFLNLIKK
jgi:predicted XRE-type DNA-binding protein